MKFPSPTAPPIYPNLPVEDGQNYRLNKISEIENSQLKRVLEKHYTKSINAV